MSYSRSSYRSSSSRYSEGVSDDSFSRTSARSARTSSLIDSDTSSSIRRTTLRSTSYGDDDDFSSRRSARTTTSILDDDDFGSSSVRRSIRSSRIGSRDEDDEAFSSSVRRALRDSDSFESSVRRTSRTSSILEDADDYSSSRALRRLKDDDDDYSFSKKSRLTKASIDVDENSSSVSVRAAKTSLSFDTDDSGTSTFVRSTRSAVSYSEARTSDASEPAVTPGGIYAAILDYSPPESDKEGISLKEGQEVEVLDASKPRRWLVKTLPTRSGLTLEGWVPSAYLEKKEGAVVETLPPEERTDPKEKEAMAKREAVVKELVETEEDFSRDMQYVVNHYLKEMDNSKMPKELRDQKDVLFSNFKAISEFHNNVLIKGVQYYASEPAKLGVTFLRLERDFDKHVKYCQDEPQAQELLKSGPLKEYFDQYSKKIGDDKSLSEHLKLPIQRINDYQLLLKELIKYTARLKENYTDLQRALDFMQAIPQRATDLQYINAIEGYRGNIHKWGRVIKHDWFEIKDANNQSRERYLFLFKGRLCITEVKKMTSKRSVYLMKNIVKTGDTEVSEDSGDELALKVEHKDKSQSEFPVTLRAKNKEQKEAWAKELHASTLTPAYLEEDDIKIVHEEVKEEPQAKKPKVDTPTASPEVKVTTDSNAQVEVLTDFEAYEEMNTQVTESLRSESVTSLEASEMDGNNSKPVFRKTLRGLTCMQGESTSFECEILSSPPISSITWLKNNKPVPKKAHIEEVNKGNKYSLAIKDLSTEDAGLYTVIASNTNGTASCSAPLHIKSSLEVPKEDSRPTSPGGTILPHAPVFKVKLKDTELLEGTSVRFELVVRGQPEPTVTFYKNEEPLKQDDRVRIHFESKEVFELIIDHVTQEDAGNYSCVAINSEGKDITTGSISVTKIKVLFRGLEDDDVSGFKSATPPPRSPAFRWFKDGSEFEASERFQVTFDDVEDTVALVFQHVTPEDAGLYTCVANTTSGKMSCSAELTVQGTVIQREPEAPSIQASLSDLEVSEGASAMLELKVKGYPKPKMTWKKDGEEIQAGGRHKFLFEDDESMTLVIKNVVKSDTGKYSVVAENEHGTADTECQLTVTSAPSFRKQLKDTAVMTDEPMKLEVEIEGVPVPDVKWYKDGQQIVENKRVKITQKDDHFALVVNKAQTEDAGNYSCVAKNNAGSQTSFGAVSVNAPASIVKKLQSYEASEAEVVSFRIKVSGSPKPTVEWLKDGKPLKIDGKKYQVVEEEPNSYTLTVDNMAKSDTGKYSCIVKNDFGSQTDEASLTMKVKPSFAKSLSDCEAKEGDVDVAFTIKVEGTPPPKVAWLHDNVQITDTVSHSFVSDEASGEFTLILKKVTPEMAGKYTCEASNSVGQASSSGILTVNSTPKFIKGLKDTEAVEGQSAEFSVKIAGHPKPSVQWTKEGAELTIDGKHAQVKEEADASFTLILKNVSPKDIGTYGCHIKNQYGEASSSGKLTTKSKPFFKRELSDQEAAVGDKNLEFAAEVTGMPKPDIKWFHDKEEVKEDETYQITSDEETGSHVLKIKDVSKKSAGQYTCEAENSCGKETSSGNLTVNYKPEVIEDMKDIEGQIGEAVSFNVKISGCPKPDVKWKRNGEDVTVDAYVKITEDGESYSLAFDELTLILAGDYECIAQNKLGEATTKGKLTVTCKPKFEKGLSDQEVWSGEETIFEVKVSGIPEADILWFKDGQPLKTDDRITTSSQGDVHRLVIKKAKMDDSSVYSCKAKNKVGEVSQRAQLTVKCPDDSEAPTFIRKMVDTLAVIGDVARLEVRVAGKPTPTVSWLKDGKEISSGDKISIKEDGDTHNITLHNLVPGDEAQYTCKAVNDKGEATNAAKLTVKEPVAPTIENIVDQEVTLGTVAKFEAKITGLPTPDVTWSKDGAVVKASEKIVITSDTETETYTLTVRRVEECHLGEYTLTASNSAGKAESKAKLATKAEAPTFLKPLSDGEVAKGADAAFEVRVGGYPEPTISWFLNGKALKPSERIAITQKGDVFSLKISGVLTEDVGEIICKAQNSAGEASSQAALKLKETAPEMKKGLPKSASVSEGDVLRLEAKVDGNPRPEIQWLKDGVPLTPSDKIKMESLPDGTEVLTITGAKPEDAGRYTLRATNPQGQVDSDSDVSVKADDRIAPSFVKQLEPTSLILGQPGKLQVKVAGKPKPTLAWEKNKKSIVPNTHIKFLEEPDGTSVLLIDEARPEDAGRYAVVATNEKGEATTKAEITTMSSPSTPKEPDDKDKPCFLQGLVPSMLTEEQPAKLQVQVAGNPQPAVKWLKNGVPISPDDHIKIIENPEDGTSTLEFDKVVPQDAGQYAAVAVNDKGENTSEAKVITTPPLDLSGMKPEFLTELKNENLLEGQPLTLVAKIKSATPFTVKWTKDGEEVVPGDRIVLTQEPDGTVLLSIDHALPSDAAKYVCIASNPDGKSRSAGIVDVAGLPKEKPAILQELQPAVLTEGQPGKLEAKVSGEPKPDIKWLKNGQEVPSSDRIRSSVSPEGDVALIIDPVEPSDAGKYSLVVANDHGESRTSAPVTVNQPPIFVKPLEPTEVVEGYPARLEAKLTGEPTPEISWLKDGEPVAPDGTDLVEVKTPEGDVTLIIAKSKPENAGTYSCKATNPFGETRSDGPLTVAGADQSKEPQKEPSFITPLSDLEVGEGESIELEAKVSGNPLPEIKWFLDDQPLLPSDNIHQTFDGRKVKLHIQNAIPNHAGVYDCRLTNPLGKASSQSVVKVTEKSAPRFIQRLSDLEAPSTGPLKLTCKVKGHPEAEIDWLYNGHPIEPGLKYNMAKEGPVCSLTLPWPRAKDSGLYECRAKNPLGEDRTHAKVTLSDKAEKAEAPIFLKKLGDLEVLEGGIAKFTACVAGYPLPEVKWFKNGEELDFTPRHKMEYEPNGLLRLIIRDVVPGDLGEYRVSIYNPHGSDTCTGTLRLESLDDKSKSRPIGDQYLDFDKFKKTGVPVPLSDKPRIVRMNDDYLTLAWKPSIPIAPRVPVTYSVETSPHPDGDWTPYKSGIKDSVLDIRGLEPFKDYRFRIRVENKYGVSDPSPYVSAHRSRLSIPEPAQFKPKDYEIEHPPLDKYGSPPRFLRREEDTMYGIRGHPVSIEFWVYGCPQPEITWYFNGSKLEMGGRYDHMQDRNGQVTLFLTRMTEDSVGAYTCSAVNEHGEAQKTINLELAETPMFIKRLDPTTIMVRRGGRLECRVIGKPYPQIKWFKDWHPLYESSRVQILWEAPDKCTLTLSNSITRDAGLYSCTATNIAGTASCSAEVVIEESESEYDILTYRRPRVFKPRAKPFEDYYDIGDELGRGTQGIVYHAVERSSGKSYAAKTMHGKGKFRDWMQAEMDIMNQLCHPRLVRLWDAFETKHSMSLITDLCGGGELLDNIINRGSLTESEVAHYIKQVLEGLDYMHLRNIGHLGLTIGDILVSRINSDNIKIADFGLATRLHKGKDYFLDYGHPEFVAPEIANKKPATLAADMWSVGVVTYLLLSGISPFLGENDRETLKRVQTGKINFLHDGFAEVSDDARDFISKLLVFDPSGRLDVRAALDHPWLKNAEIPDKGDNLSNIDRLREYYQKWKKWYANASCRRFYRRRPLESCFTHPSKMIYPPDEEYTPPPSPDRDLERSRVKPSEFDDTFQQKINREVIDVQSESNYQSGPDTYLLQLRDTDFPLRIRQYLRVGAQRSPSLAANLREKHWGGCEIFPRGETSTYPQVAVRERRKFVDVMDEEIDDEKKGLSTRNVPLRLIREVGTMGYAHKQLESLKQEAWKDKDKTREAAIGTAPFFREKIQDAVIKENDEVVFRCYAVGSPAPSYSWFRNDGILIESSRIQVKNLPDGRCELHLKPGKAYDVGVFKCVARNSHGLAVSRARLKMGDKPCRPEPPVVEQSSANELYVRWCNPRYEGNSPTFLYSLEQKEGETGEWTKISEEICHEFWVAHNLTPSTIYQYRVSAKNSFGWSEPSLPSDAATTGAEGSPKIKISKARKFQQQMTERGQCPMLDDDDDFVKLDYEQEKNPVQLQTGDPLEMNNFISEIAMGRFSAIVNTWSKTLNKTLAVKAIITPKETEASIHREYEIMKSLCHERIVLLENASFHDGLTILGMEKLSGVDVLTYLTSRYQYNEEMVARIIKQVLDGLEYLHYREICYLEIQPDNVVMISEKACNIKLVDFGSAQFIPKTGAKVSTTGTTEYLAPEILKGEEVGPATDIWCVGVLAYILLSGFSPFLGADETETKNNILYVRYHFDKLYHEASTEATRFLMQLFKRTPEKRPTIDECLENKWLLPSEFMLRKREHAIFLSHRLLEFAAEFHSKKRNLETAQKLLTMFGMSFSKSISLETDVFEEY